MNIELHGQDGSVWYIHGDRAGAQGVALLEGASGFWEAPVTSVWMQGAFQEGATYVGYRTEPLDVVLPIAVRGDSATEWHINDSKFRNALGSPDEEFVLVARSVSGTRRLTLRLTEAPEIVGDYDPAVSRVSRYVVQARAGWPRWVGGTATSTWSTSSASGSGTVTIQNPTDTWVYVQWVCSAPGKWVLPDYSWPDPLISGRLITTPTLGVGQDLSIDTYPFHEHYVAADGHNIAGRFGGVLFLHPVPPHTPPTEVPVSVTGATGGGSVQVRIPMNFRKPRGGDVIR